MTDHHEFLNDEFTHFLTDRIDRHSRSRASIASAAGLKVHAMIRMAAGEQDLPINKVDALAKALDIDPLTLLAFACSRLAPEAFDSFLEERRRHVAPRGHTESYIIRAFRAACEMEGKHPDNEEVVSDVVKAIRHAVSNPNTGVW